MARYNFPVPTILGNIEPPVLPTDALPNIPATTTTLGGVKVDGTSITIDANGVISASGGGGGGGSFWYGAALGAAPLNDKGDNGEWFIDYLSDDWMPYYKQDGEWKLATTVDKDFSLYPLIRRLSFKSASEPAIGASIDYSDPVFASEALYNNAMTLQTGRNVIVYGDEGTIVTIWQTQNPNEVRKAYALGKAIGGVVNQTDGGTAPWRGHIIGFSIDNKLNVTVIARFDDAASINAILNCKSLRQDATTPKQYQGVCDFTDVYADKTMLVGVSANNAIMVRSPQDDTWQAGPDVSSFIKGSGQITTAYDSNAKQWTIAGGGDLPNIQTVTGGLSYTVRKSDTNLVVYFSDLRDYGRLFLDSDENYLPGTQVTIITNGAFPVQAIPLKATILDTGNPGVGGRGFVTAQKNAQDRWDYIDTRFSLLYVGDNKWLVRGPKLTMGAPWVEFVGRPTDTLAPGTVLFKTNTSGEDLATVINMTLVASENSGKGPEVTIDVTKNIREYTWTGLKEGMQYKFSCRYKTFVNNVVGYVDSWNSVLYKVDSNTPSTPTNVKITGSRGARLFFTFNYPDIAAPWDVLQVQVLSSDGRSVIQGWVEMLPQKDPDTNQYLMQFWPTYKQVVGDTQVQVRLGNRAKGLFGEASAPIKVNWDTYMPKTNITSIDINKALKTATITWAQFDTYNDPNCKINIIVKKSDGTVVQTGQTDWNDTDTVFNGQSGTSYSVTVTPQTYGRDGTPESKDFFIPFPFQ
jgi:hypothetical protein